MKLAARTSKREQAQELMWEAMDAIVEDEARAAVLCRQALEAYPDCVDALAMLAELESRGTQEHGDRLRAAVEAGRRDLGPKCFKEDKGYFWGLLETRPFMRAMSQLGFVLLEQGTPKRVAEAVEVFEEMLELNPNDNQGVRDWLAGGYLALKRYDDAAALLKRYEDDWLAAPAWARVLLAHVTEGEKRAAALLRTARKRNRHVEAYLTGAKPRPSARAGAYSPGDESEALYCADMLWKAWEAHPEAVQWLKGKAARVGTKAPRKKASR